MFTKLSQHLLAAAFIIILHDNECQHSRKNGSFNGGQPQSFPLMSFLEIIMNHDQIQHNGTGCLVPEMHPVSVFGYAETQVVAGRSRLKDQKERK